MSDGETRSNPDEEEKRMESKEANGTECDTKGKRKKKSGARDDEDTVIVTEDQPVITLSQIDQMAGESLVATSAPTSTLQNKPANLVGQDSPPPLATRSSPLRHRPRSNDAEETTSLIIARMRKDARTLAYRGKRRLGVFCGGLDRRDVVLMTVLIALAAYVIGPWLAPRANGWSSLFHLHREEDEESDRAYRDSDYFSGINSPPDDEEVRGHPRDTYAEWKDRKRQESQQLPVFARRPKSPPPPQPPPREPPQVPDYASALDADHLRFFFAAREVEHIRPISEALPLLTADGLDSFVNGYIRGRFACEDVAHYLGWIGLIESSPSDTRSKFNSRLYLSSSSIYSPYFCLNFPLEQFMQADGELRRLSDLRNIGSRRDANSNNNNNKRGKKTPTVTPIPLIDDWVLNQLVDTIFTSWKVLTESRDGAQYTASPTDSFAQSPIHNMHVMGYDSNGFFARNLTALGDAKTPLAEVVYVYYDSFVATARQLFNDASTFAKNQKLNAPVCLCGAHVALGRHLVAYSDGKQKQVVYIEPIVVKSSGMVSAEPSISPTGRGMHQSEKRSFAWTANVNVPVDDSSRDVWKGISLSETSTNKNNNGNGLFAQYVKTDGLLRERFGIANGVNMATSITVDYVTITPHTQGTANAPPQDFYNNKGARTIADITGQEALCIQYCEHMAYALMGQMEHADKLKDIKLKLPAQGH